jgi:hypothetical protein
MAKKKDKQKPSKPKVDLMAGMPSRMESNPMAWMVMVNGLIVDARRLPRPLQEEAYRKGLIPYIPGERDVNG